MQDQRRAKDLLAVDSLRPQNTATDTLPSVKISKNVPESSIVYKASDSLRAYIRKGYIALYGSADLSYKEFNLKAAQAHIDWSQQELIASSVPDSTGKAQDAPVFTEKGKVYYMDSIRYNFKSRRAAIQGVVTKEGDGYVHGKRVKMNIERDLYVSNARYTTCNRKEPHYHFHARQAKVISSKTTVTGPFHMRVAEAPLPIGFFFGVFPHPRKSASGIIMPYYGEERLRGFFLQKGGYYFAINEYMDLEVTGDIYSKGSYGLYSNWRYSKRYSYSGSTNLRYTYSVGDETNSFSSKDYWISWQHSPTSRRDSRFSASVNAGTSTFYRNNFQSSAVNTNTEWSSNITYNKTFTGTPFNMNLSLRHRQNVERDELTLRLPEMSWNMRRIYPLQRFSRHKSSSFRKLGLSHSMQLSNLLSNKRRATAAVSSSSSSLDFFEMLRHADNGIRHQVPVALPLNVFRYFVLTPSFNYTELWYARSLRHRYDEATGEIRRDTLSGFSRAGHYSLSSGLSTRIYGIFRFKKGSFVQAIRHLMTPNLSISYRPDFSHPRYGIHRSIETPTGPRQVSKFDGFVFGTTPRNAVASISFGLGNQFEMKYRKKTDTTNTNRKVRLLDNLSFGGSYNFLADSFNLSRISIAARTSLFKNRVAISSSATLDPYKWEEQSSRWIRRPSFAWQGRQGLGTITSINTSVSLSLRPTKKPKSKGKASKSRGDTSSSEKGELRHIQNNPNLYIDFDLPWTLQINYNINQRRRGRASFETIQSLSFSGSLSLTSKTHISLSSGYDFKRRALTQSSIGFVRDLHCWEITGGWVPFGHFRSYNVTIRVRSQVLQGLRLSRRRSFFDSFGFQ